MTETKIKSGDIVEILKPNEILKTLDSNGALNNLPFMPEMVRFCGKKYRVSNNLEKICVACKLHDHVISNKIKELIPNDVLFLEGIRCDGELHDSCQVGCMIIWKEAWLKKTSDKKENIFINENDKTELRKLLRTKLNGGIYYCQSTQLEQITRKITIKNKFQKLLKEIYSGEIDFYTAVKSMIYPILRKFIYDKFIKGILKNTPTSVLNLQPGEYVEVRSFDEIRKTLDNQGRNRGLSFYHDMKKHCHKKYRVRNRVDKMIDEITGEMIKVKNTVILEEVTCSYEYAFMGCPRARYQLWREIWLKRAKNEE